MADSHQDVAKSKSTANMSKTQSMLTVGSGKSLSRMKVRRQTLGFGSVPGIRPVERTSMLGIEFKRPPLLFLNTYQLEPSIKFNNAKILEEIEDMLDEHFTEHKYNVQESTALAVKLAGEIMRLVKGMGYGRYRLIAIVTIGQKRAQCYNNGLAFVWDHERDTYINCQREVCSAFIQVTLLAVYLD